MRNKPILRFWLLSLLPCFGETIPEFTNDGYRVPQPGQVLEFPRDHGSHPDYRIEWWYLTGHLEDDQGDRHGFQLTFFRSALRPPGEREPGASPFGRNQLHMAHSAWVEIGAKRFTSEERLAREGWDAGASAERLQLHQGEWKLAARDDTAQPILDAFFTVRDRHRALLTFEPAKPFVRFGEDGVERKGASPTAASLYITFTRLKVSGVVEIGGEPRKVRGEAWMDHEISSSQLDQNQVGWDWASIQLGDGREIMMYILRRDDGSVDPYSVLYWIDREGVATLMTPDQFTWTARRKWTSPTSGGVYPLEWDLTVQDPERGAPVTLRISPVLDAQEHEGRLSGIPYWEGACEVHIGGAPAGRAFVELTGYADSAVDALR